jgi:hypothetical protein
LGVAEADERKSKTNPNVVTVTLSPLTRMRLEALGRGEYFGNGASAVARRLIEDGIRRVVEQGWLPDSKLPPAANSHHIDRSPDEPEPMA